MRANLKKTPLTGAAFSISDRTLHPENVSAQSGRVFVSSLVGVPNLASMQVSSQKYAVLLEVYTLVLIAPSLLLVQAVLLFLA